MTDNTVTNIELHLPIFQMNWQLFIVMKKCIWLFRTLPPVPNLCLPLVLQQRPAPGESKLLCFLAVPITLVCPIWNLTIRHSWLITVTPFFSSQWMSAIFHYGHRFGYDVQLEGRCHWHINSSTGQSGLLHLFPDRIGQQTGNIIHYLHISPCNKINICTNSRVHRWPLCSASKSVRHRPPKRSAFPERIWPEAKRWMIRHATTTFYCSREERVIQLSVRSVLEIVFAERYLPKNRNPDRLKLFAVSDYIPLACTYKCHTANAAFFCCVRLRYSETVPHVLQNEWRWNDNGHGGFSFNGKSRLLLSVRAQIDIRTTSKRFIAEKFVNSFTTTWQCAAITTSSRF